MAREPGCGGHGHGLIVREPPPVVPAKRSPRTCVRASDPMALAIRRHELRYGGATAEASHDYA